MSCGGGQFILQAIASSSGVSSAASFVECPRFSGFCAWFARLGRSFAPMSWRGFDRIDSLTNASRLRATEKVGLRATPRANRHTAV